jgi:hypothetical protein
LTPEKEEHLRSQEQARLARQTVDNLRKLTHDYPRQQERLAQLGPLLEQNISLIEGRPGLTGDRTDVSPLERRRPEEIDDRETQLDAIVTAMQDEEEVLLGVLSARLRSVRPGRHGSEAVTLRHPVMPVANGLGRGLVGINGDQL